MAKGAPDYTKFVKLMAWNGTDLVPVLVDENGQFYALLKGHNGTQFVPLKVDAKGRIEAIIQGGTVDSIAGNVTVDQSEKDREIRGSDGTTLRTIAVDSQGRMIAVIYGDQAIPIAQDSTGALVALMKGEYLGALKNVAVDDQGRMIMIPTDPADVWGNAISVGNAELAVRLGSCVSFQRSGDARFLDDFTAGLGMWETLTTGNGVTPELVTDHARFGGYAVKLAGTSGAAWTSYIRHYEPVYSYQRWGLSCWSTLFYTEGYFRMELKLYDGTNLHHWGIRIDYGNQRFEYIDSGGNWSVMHDSVKFGTSDYMFHPLKMVIDVENNKYHHTYFDSYDWDDSNLSCYVKADAAYPHVEIILTAEGTEYGTSDVFVDGVVFTVNEP